MCMNKSFIINTDVFIINTSIKKKKKRIVNVDLIDDFQGGFLVRSFHSNK